MLGFSIGSGLRHGAGTARAVDGYIVAQGLEAFGEKLTESWHAAGEIKHAPASGAEEMVMMGLVR
jgi:hypothetical protein